MSVAVHSTECGKSPLLAGQPNEVQAVPGMGWTDKGDPQVTGTEFLGARQVLKTTIDINNMQ